MSYSFLRPTLLIALILSLSFPVIAGDARDEQLLNDLRELTEKSRQERAADRWLQQALEDLVARYDWPWQQELLYEDFADGDYTRNPAWQVHSGRFWNERSLGLRSRVDASTQTQASDQQVSPEAAIAGLLVDSLFGGSQKSQQQPAQPAYDPTQPAEIRLNTHTTNAFALESNFNLAPTQTAGQFSLALLQSSAGQYGYRLRVMSGSRSLVELERIRAGRSAIVDGHELEQDIADGRNHDLEWRQAPDGQVTVLLDGNQLFSVKDNAFRDAYPVLAVTNQAGDLAVKKIRITGTK